MCIKLLSTKLKVTYLDRNPHISETSIQHVSRCISPAAAHMFSCEIGLHVKVNPTARSTTLWRGRASVEETVIARVTAVCARRADHSVWGVTAGIFCVLGSSHTLGFNMTVLHLCLFATFWRAVSMLFNVKHFLRINIYKWLLY